MSVFLESEGYFFKTLVFTIVFLCVFYAVCECVFACCLVPLCMPVYILCVCAGGRAVCELNQEVYQIAFETTKM